MSRTSDICEASSAPMISFRMADSFTLIVEELSFRSSMAARSVWRSAFDGACNLLMLAWKQAAYSKGQL